MINLIIDSTHFKRDRSLNKLELTKLKALGKRDYLKIHIPWFVYKECTSTYKEEIGIKLNNVKTILKTLDRQGIDESTQNHFLEIAGNIDHLHQNIEQSIADNWKIFIEESKAELYPFDEKISSLVYESYFEGSPPFKSLKSRKDIPDAYIYQRIKNVSELGATYLISGDRNLRDKSTELNNVIAFEKCV